ncbi:MAG TPA: hypothetical protein VIH12_06955 [Solibacillus sp.]
MKETILKLASENAVKKFEVCKQYVDTAKNPNSAIYQQYHPKMKEYQFIINNIYKQLKGIEA